jgi:hypothetical protein
LAKIFRSKIQAWVAMGNPNVKHYEVFLDAEWAALKGKNFTAMKHYEATVLSAVRGGYQHDAALATERFGEFHLLVLGDRPEAINQFTHSIKYWRDWGAIAKVRHLEEKNADLMFKST